MMYAITNMRLTGLSKCFYHAQLREFADRFSKKEIKSVYFGKADIRGGFSITLHDHQGRCPSQKQFESKESMLGFVVGVNFANPKKKIKTLSIGL